ncbi:hypothetical protein B0H13DRAFT_2675063 [Mycena leptocephala]|nr:hypothetical protein B0H13DRAFT_2675063 [Mycena leptocephala]
MLPLPHGVLYADADASRVLPLDRQSLAQPSEEHRNTLCANGFSANESFCVRTVSPRLKPREGFVAHLDARREHLRAVTLPCTTSHHPSCTPSATPADHLQRHNTTGDARSDCEAATHIRHVLRDCSDCDVAAPARYIISTLDYAYALDACVHPRHDAHHRSPALPPRTPASTIVPTVPRRRPTHSPLPHAALFPCAVRTTASAPPS